jgi:hypothetical protein
MVGIEFNGIFPIRLIKKKTINKKNNKDLTTLELKES